MTSHSLLLYFEDIRFIKILKYKILRKILWESPYALSSLIMHILNKHNGILLSSLVFNTTFDYSILIIQLFGRRFRDSKKKKKGTRNLKYGSLKLGINFVFELRVGLTLETV